MVEPALKENSVLNELPLLQKTTALSFDMEKYTKDIETLPDGRLFIPLFSKQPEEDKSYFFTDPNFKSCDNCGRLPVYCKCKDKLTGSDPFNFNFIAPVTTPEISYKADNNNEEVLIERIKNSPVLIRAYFEKAFYKAPWMGWLPMLSEIKKSLKKVK